jgi:hypothetical protein
MVRAGSHTAIARALVRVYGLRVATWLPATMAAVAVVLAGVAAPHGLADNTTHAEWKDIFGTGGQIIATLLVALVVEARTPFSRSGRLAVRIPVFAAAFLLGTGGVAALLGLSPSLPGGVYPWLLALTVGGAVGGFAAVMLIGVAAALGTLKKVDARLARKLKDLGDPAALEDILQSRGDLGDRPDISDTA